jgi:putative endonuclease
MSFFAYILKSLKDGKYYYGHCENLDSRVKRPNAGHVKSTKSRRPFLLHYSEEFVSKPEAAKREYFFKTIDGFNYLKSNGII